MQEEPQQVMLYWSVCLVISSKWHRVPIKPCRFSGWYSWGHRSVMPEIENTSTSNRDNVPCWWSHLLDSVVKASSLAFEHGLHILWAAHTALNVLSLCLPLASSFTSLLFHGDRGLLHCLAGVPEISPPPPYSAFRTPLGLSLWSRSGLLESMRAAARMKLKHPTSFRVN